MTAVKSIAKPPKAVVSTVERMLALRDVLAHVHTINPDHAATIYKGHSIFSKAGLEIYSEDAHMSIVWLLDKWRSLHRRSTRLAEKASNGKTGARVKNFETDTIL